MTHFFVYFAYFSLLASSVNPIQDGGSGGEGKKAHPTSFSPATSTNIGISPPKFLTFCFNSFATLM